VLAVHYTYIHGILATLYSSQGGWLCWCHKHCSCHCSADLSLGNSST